ncbi:MAG: hypothetical protein FJY86_01950 [Candidatus Diapherotrites archaeon]|uniref:Uncharacterized protein n=1 Tax=Candidatus Iainarchaeum sp. TaxID=3101447 RepID=A0A8T4CAC4_9ARCH|nr:hypothetical protein [Candidatus Diapherotrites archaeon]
MTNHDSRKLTPQALLEQISPEFSTLTADLNEVMNASKDNPMIIAALLFKLAQERKQTNDLLAKMEQKYDELSFTLKSNASSISTNPTQPENMHSISLLPEQDQKILSFIESKTKANAEDVRAHVGYKNPNAASQRLNALVKTGYLGKIQSGKKVVFVRTNQ